MDLFSLYLKKLKEAVAIKSVSTDVIYKQDIQRMVDWLKNELNAIGYSVTIFTEYGNPVILAKLNINAEAETVLLYGHYDVQPAEKSDGWRNDPFKLTQDSDRVYARGVIDNKGQFLIYLATIQKLIEDKSLGKNIIFLLEGNEETGSPLLTELIKTHKDLLKSDFAVISDGLTSENPIVEASFRGNVNSELTIFGPGNALHSGSYGGIVYNPINVLNYVLSKISNPIGDTSILKSAIIEPTANDIIRMQAKKYDIDMFKVTTGYEKPAKDDDLSIKKAIGFENSIQITGIIGGYVGEGFKNAIPTKATAKINFRLNFGITPDQVKEALEQFFLETIPEGIKYEFTCKDLSFGAKLDLDNDYVKKIKLILEKVYQNNAVYLYVGGTLPISYDIANVLNVPAVFVGLANSDSNMHGANENYRIDYIHKALEFATALLQK